MRSTWSIAGTGETLVMLLTEAAEDGMSKPVRVSVAFSAALVRDLLDRVPEASSSEAQS